MNKIEFKEKMAAANAAITDTMLEQYTRYAALLKEWNEKMNLSAIIEEEEVFALHFYDSVLGFAKISNKEEIKNFADVGAGAGFPSLPIKIAFPHLEITIIEPLAKRCTFLKEVVKELGLEKVNIVNARAEDFAIEHRESFDLVSARAVANLNMLSELCIPLVKEHGLFMAMKGSSGMQENESAKDALRILGVKLENVCEEHVGEHTHINLYYRKIAKTPKKYPRAFAKIKKNPL